jgi:putative ABC transport system ATP-binding protein
MNRERYAMRDKRASGNGRPTWRDGGHLIELRDVVKVYEIGEGGYTALDDVSMTVEGSELLGIIGKSGSGKSTLLNMITGIDHPTSGEVLVEGTAVHTMSEGDLAPWRGKTMGIVFQFFQLLPTLSVADNVMLPMDFCDTYPRRERRGKAVDLLGQLEVAEQADKLPSSLSGGQQQRVAIARALANDPPIIVADEPTGNLDSHTAEAVFEYFERLVREEGKTVIIVTHDPDLARRMGRTVTISDGRIVHGGPGTAGPEGS